MCFNVHQVIRGELTGVFYSVTLNIMVHHWEMGGGRALFLRHQMNSTVVNWAVCLSGSTCWIQSQIPTVYDEVGELCCSVQPKVENVMGDQFFFFFFYSFSTFNTIECVLCIVNMWYLKCIRVLTLFDNLSFHFIVLLPTSIQIKLNKNNWIWTDM